MLQLNVVSHFYENIQFEYFIGNEQINETIDTILTVNRIT